MLASDVEAWVGVDILTSRGGVFLRPWIVVCVEVRVLEDYLVIGLRYSLYSLIPEELRRIIPILTVKFVELLSLHRRRKEDLFGGERKD